MVEKERERERKRELGMLMLPSKQDLRLPGDEEFPAPHPLPLTLSSLLTCRSALSREYARKRKLRMRDKRRLSLSHIQTSVPSMEFSGLAFVFDLVAYLFQLVLPLHVRRRRQSIVSHTILLCHGYGVITSSPSFHGIYSGHVPDQSPSGKVNSHSAKEQAKTSIRTLHTGEHVSSEQVPPSVAG